MNVSKLCVKTIITFIYSYRTNRIIVVFTEPVLFLVEVSTTVSGKKFSLLSRFNNW
jgi:hypothetical protein